MRAELVCSYRPDGQFSSSSSSFGPSYLPESRLPRRILVERTFPIHAIKRVETNESRVKLLVLRQQSISEDLVWASRPGDAASHEIHVPMCDQLARSFSAPRKNTAEGNVILRFRLNTRRVISRLGGKRARAGHFTKNKYTLIKLPFSIYRGFLLVIL